MRLLRLVAKLTIIWLERRSHSTLDTVLGRSLLLPMRITSGSSTKTSQLNQQHLALSTQSPSSGSSTYTENGATEVPQEKAWLIPQQHQPWEECSTNTAKRKTSRYWTLSEERSRSKFWNRREPLTLSTLVTPIGLTSTRMPLRLTALMSCLMPLLGVKSLTSWSATCQRLELLSFMENWAVRIWSFQSLWYFREELKSHRFCCSNGSQLWARKKSNRSEAVFQVCWRTNWLPIRFEH